MKVGEYNNLTILRFTSVGAYLSDNQGNEVLLPNKYLDDTMYINEKINVFVYRDSEDRIVATTEDPFIKMNGFAYLRTTSITNFGAFVDWGLEKELMIPFKEQNLKLEVGRFYLTYLFLDEKTDRVVGSTRINKYLRKCTDQLKPEMKVDLLICENTDLGVKTIVNNKYGGLIFRNDISKEIKRGDIIKGYVSNIRKDGKIDIRLNMSGYEKIKPTAEKILDLLKKNKTINLTDKSSPEDIREILGISKKTFKQAIGNLYKRRLIKLNKTNISIN
ncbi:MAG: GntR family transcriptional regulator [Crocinitomicaceae bacterium]|nr:GntR family transcriptional regulator [Crocinitomicaceae bacterium]|tara:strand:+ start:6275 stop:7099 length:825 start_codon:yes stop_codon:yes gene_type:complete